MTRINIRRKQKSIQQKKAIYVGLRVVSPIVEVTKVMMAMPIIKDTARIRAGGGYGR